MTRLSITHPLDPTHLEIREADRQLHMPSAAEVLTIAQCGFPRTYNLNDGMGQDIAV